MSLPTSRRCTGSAESSESQIITIDPGAAESVLNANMATQIPRRPSPGSFAVVEYYAAHESRMINEGQTQVPVVGADGMRCGLRMWVADLDVGVGSSSRISCLRCWSPCHVGTGFFSCEKTSRTQHSSYAVQHTEYRGVLTWTMKRCTTYAEYQGTWPSDSCPVCTDLTSV